MAVVQHKNITNADLHECKGASAAAVGQVLIAKGDGTATFQNITPRGSNYFVDLATPYTLAYPAVYTKLAPTTTSTSLTVDYTVSTTGRLTYTGTRTLAMWVMFNVSLSQASGANRDIEIAIYKNGSLVTGSSVVTTTVSAVKVDMTSFIDVSLATNDYVEAYVKNAGAGGDILVNAFYLTAFGMQ
jgi:hypothetical protein